MAMMGYVGVAKQASIDIQSASKHVEMAPRVCVRRLGRLGRVAAWVVKPQHRDGGGCRETRLASSGLRVASTARIV